MNGDGVIASEFVAGRTLNRFDADAIDDSLLADVWEHVAAMRSARIAQRDLRVAQMWVADDGGAVFLLDWGDAEAAAGGDSLDQDVAQLIASLSQ